MKNINFILTLAVCALLSPSCKFISAEGLAEECGSSSAEQITASDKYVTRSIEIGEFTRIAAVLPCDLTYSAGEPGLSVYTSDNVIDELTFDIDAAGTLAINVKDGCNIRKLKTLKIRLSSSALRGVKVQGASEFKIEDGLVTDSLGIDISGAAEIDIDGLKTDALNIDIKGAGDIDIERLVCGAAELAIKGAGDCTLSGKAESVHVDVKGAGDVDLSELECADVTTSIKGAGSVKRNKRLGF